MAYITVGDEEARQLMQDVPEGGGAVVR